MHRQVNIVIHILQRIKELEVENQELEVENEDLRKQLHKSKSSELMHVLHGTCSENCKITSISQ